VRRRSRCVIQNEAVSGQSATNRVEPSRGRRGWRESLTGFVQGVVVGGLIINILSNDYRWLAVVAAEVIALVLAVVAWLHRLPARSPFVRWSTGALLALAGVATLSAALGPTSLGPWATGVAALLVVGATLVPTDRIKALHLLSLVTAIGFGISAVGAGIHLVVDGKPDVGVALSVFGLAVVGSVTVTALGGDAAAYVGLIVVGLTVMIMGVAALGRTPTAPAAVGLIIVALALIGLGVAGLIYGIAKFGVSLIVAGPVVAGAGVTWIVGGDTAFGAGIIAFGLLVMVGGGIAWLLHLPSWIVIVVGSLILAGMGILFTSGSLLARLAIIGFGVAIAAVAVNHWMKGDGGRRLQEWWTSVTADPVDSE
jgi:hypothetical protein